MEVTEVEEVNVLLLDSVSYSFSDIRHPDVLPFDDDKPPEDVQRQITV